MAEKYILQVEDSSDDAMLTLHALKKADVKNRVEVVADGAEAIDFLFCKGRFAERKPADLPAFVLLDLKLPKVDGFEVLRSIRGDRRTALLPVVVFTSSREEKDVALAYELAANSYIRKPVDFGRFAETIRQIGSYWLELNEAPY